MTTHVEEGQQFPSSKVFINYYEKDSSFAHRLYSDLKTASLNPWIDKENLLPGQYTEDVTMKTIKESDYFVALLSTNSIQAKGTAQKQIESALKVLSGYPEFQIYLIPARLDKVEIPYKLSQLTYVDLFPSNWEEGLKKILQAMNVKPDQINLVIQHQRNFSIPIFRKQYCT